MCTSRSSASKSLRRIQYSGDRTDTRASKRLRTAGQGIFGMESFHQCSVLTCQHTGWRFRQPAHVESCPKVGICEHVEDIVAQAFVAKRARWNLERTDELVILGGKSRTLVKSCYSKLELLSED